MACAECDALNAQLKAQTRQIVLLTADRDRVVAERLRAERNIKRIRDIAMAP